VGRRRKVDGIELELRSLLDVFLVRDLPEARAKRNYCTLGGDKKPYCGLASITLLPIKKA